MVVGNGMAGVRALEELLALAPDLYDITVFGAEAHPNYNRILLSPVLAGEQTLHDIVLNPVEWYHANGIRQDALLQRAGPERHPPGSLEPRVVPLPDEGPRPGSTRRTADPV